MVDTTNFTERTPSISLPDFFPQQNLVVDREEHRFDVFSTDSEPEPKIRYSLEKAPVDEIIRVTGIYQASTIEFTKGEDYTLSDDSTAIVFDSNNRTPVAGTTFFITYESDSILKRYLEASNDEIELTQDAIIDSVSRRFVDDASGDDLDRIGSLFGDVIGSRRGRTDADYRAYLKSVVQSFVSRGTISGLKLSISAATDVPIEDIEIRENFEDNEYEVVVIPQTPVTGTTIEEIAEIADPSGVEQVVTRFTPEAEVIGADDSAAFVPSIDGGTDTMFVDDSTANQGTGTFEIIGNNDAVNIDPNTFSSNDTLGSNDTNTQTIESVGWDTAVWGEANWAVENN